MIAMTTAQMCAAAGGTLYGDPSAVITSLSTDSRSICTGDWFVPIAGERFDGHDYIPMALEKGAAGCFCTRLPRETRDDRVYILVEDTKRALRDLAAWYRNQFDIPIVQITGSMGKTTFKELLSGILSQRYNTLKTPGNLNGDIGAPLTLLSLTEEGRAWLSRQNEDSVRKRRAELFSALTDQEQQMMHTLLEKLRVDWEQRFERRDDPAAETPKRKEKHI